MIWPVKRPLTALEFRTPRSAAGFVILVGDDRGHRQAEYYDEGKTIPGKKIAAATATRGPRALGDCLLMGLTCAIIVLRPRAARLSRRSL